MTRIELSNSCDKRTRIFAIVFTSGNNTIPPVRGADIGNGGGSGAGTRTFVHNNAYTRLAVATEEALEQHACAAGDRVSYYHQVQYYFQYPPRELTFGFCFRFVFYNNCGF
ncbi:unnamed protein product [Ascophyllum nodosum]